MRVHEIYGRRCCRKGFFIASFSTDLQNVLKCNIVRVLKYLSEAGCIPISIIIGPIQSLICNRQFC